MGTKLRQVVTTGYKFYLAFENSFCADYITEKYFGYYTLDVILVVRGGGDYSRLLPSGTFIDASNFSSPRHLVDYLQLVARSEQLYTDYLKRKDAYEVFLDNAGLAYCSLCEKLNNVDKNRRTIDDHVTYMHKDVCWTPKDVSVQFTKYGFIGFYSGLMAILVLIWIYTQRHREDFKIST